jgi:exonuclease-1
MKPTETAASRFFSKQPAQPSPSIRTKSNRAKQEEFDLWSDDSVAEAVAAATATPESTQDLGISLTKKRKKLAVLADPVGSPADSSVGDTSQESIFTTATPNSPASVADGTPDTSFEDIDSPHILSQSTKNIRAKLSMMGYRGETPSKALTRTKSTLSTSVNSTEDHEDKDALHSQSLQDSKDIPAVVFVPNSSPPPAEVAFRSDVAEPDDNMIKDQEWLAIEQDIVQPSFGGSSKGSEDLLVPNSPEIDTEEEQRRPTFSLSRFALAG